MSGKTRTKEMKMRTLLSSSKRRVALIAAAGAMVAALLGGPALAHDRDYGYRRGYVGGYVRHDEGSRNGYRHGWWRQHHRHHHYVARDYYGRPVYGYWR